MSIEGTINSLYLDYEQTKPLFPRTKTKAISDENGVGLDATLSKIQNDLSNKATETFVANKIAEAQLGGGSGSGDIDLTGFATKDDLSNIDFPVDSVNGKTGNVSLSAADVDARPDTWLPTIAEIGAAPAGYGPGDNSSRVVTGNLDSVTVCGWYYYNTANITTTLPSGITHGWMEVMNRNGAHVIQRITDVNGRVIQRIRDAANWGNWVDCSPSSFVPTSRTVNGKALSSNVTLSASDVGAPRIYTQNLSANQAVCFQFPYSPQTYAIVTYTGWSGPSHTCFTYHGYGPGEGRTRLTYVSGENGCSYGTNKGSDSGHGFTVKVGAAGGTVSVLVMYGGVPTIELTEEKAYSLTTQVCHPIERGGTGATDAATARTNLGITPANIGAAASSHTHNYVGKVTSTDNAIARFNGTGGEIQNSAVTIDDSGNLVINGSSTLKINALSRVSNPNALPAFINNDSKNGFGYIRFEDLPGNKTLLWTNASPTSSFEEQTVSLNLSSYSEVLVFFRVYNGSGQYTSETFGVHGLVGNWCIATSNGETGSNPVQRAFNITTTGIKFNLAYYAKSIGGSLSWSSNQLIPQKIYGIK